ncbi:MAG: WecB/TagA/CpsF family glycosyltransferase [Cyclobacteriaceae bacterium]|nr:WecB/TagA/CpsF family glycosyltransferase [Cyclobacteriaceae bacterium]
MEYWIQTGLQDYVVLTGAHGIVEMQSDRELMMINNKAGLVTPDGMPEVWLGRLKGHKSIAKVYAPDIMNLFFSISPSKGYRHFLYGGKPGIAQKLADVLRERFRGIQIVGLYCPPFRALTADEESHVVNLINESKPDVVWCGLGCPKQEKWMHQFRDKLDAPVLIGVGAGFDFLTGEKPHAPRWIINSGFEWLYRMMSEPKRLWRRYLYVVPLFIILLIAEFLHLYSPDKKD